MSSALSARLGDADLPELDLDETRRYGRHLVLDQVGVLGQRRLKAARVLLVGAGGLGSPASLYLAAAGVGTLGLVDFDVVDETNLQRQVLYAQDDIGRPKVVAAAERLRGVNPHIEVVLHHERLGVHNVRQLLDAYDLVVDGSDNFSTRYLVNDACVVSGTPCVWGAVLRFEGQASVFAVPGGPCYRCLFPEPPPAGLVPSCAEGGVLGVLPGIIGSIQANEAIKLILGEGEPLVGRFLVFDALRGRFREMSLPRDPACPTCGDGASPELHEIPALCGDLPPEPNPNFDVVGDTDVAEAETEHAAPPFEIGVRQLDTWRRAGVDHLLLDVREPVEHQICHIEGAELLPLRQLPQKLAEIDRDQLIVVFCHHGGRSAQAVHFLRGQGFPRVTNLAGGIDAWAIDVDPSVARY